MPIEPAAMIHIGLPKSGTTALQGALDSERDELAKAGVTYPVLSGQTSHSLAAVDLMRHDPVAHARQTENRRRHLRKVERSTEGAWNALINQATADRSLVVSAENLVYCGDVSVRRLISSLRPRPVHVVASTRMASRILESYFAQTIKVDSVPPFDQWLRTMLLGLLDGDATSPMAWLDLVSLRKTWISAGVDSFTTIRTDRDGPSIEPVWDALVDGRMSAPEFGRANPRAPAHVTESTRLFVRQHPRLDPAVVRAVIGAVKTKGACPDPEPTGSFKIRQDVKTMIDGLFPSSETGLGPADGNAARLRLSISSPDPMTSLDLDPATSMSQFDAIVKARLTALNSSLPRARMRFIAKQALLKVIPPSWRSRVVGRLQQSIDRRPGR